MIDKTFLMIIFSVFSICFFIWFLFKAIRISETLKKGNGLKKGNIFKSLKDIRLLKGL